MIGPKKGMSSTDLSDSLRQVVSRFRAQVTISRAALAQDCVFSTVPQRGRFPETNVFTSRGGAYNIP